VKISWVVACDVISILDEVWGVDWLWAETKVGSSDTTRLVSRVCEVSLAIKLGVRNDKLDSLFVSTDCTIRAKAPEDALDCTLWKVIVWLSDWKLCFWVSNTDGEVILRMSL